jgi:microsomal dipeptidase-like Zn-dependent dipeptidase
MGLARRWPAATVALALLALGGCSGASYLLESRVNGVGERNDPLPPVAPDDQRFHDSLFIADGHADTLMWSRDMLSESSRGQVDIPRLARGNVRMQGLTVVTNTPMLRGGCVPTGGTNMTSVLAASELRPPKTWFSLRAHALYQADKLKRFAARANARPGPKVRIILAIDDLKAVMEAWREEQRGLRREPLIGVALGVEGVHWLGDESLDDEAREREIDELYAAGFRMVALTHRFNNGLSGASEGCGEPPGLSPAGDKVLAGLRKRGMMVDLAHISHDGLQQALRDANIPPPFVSHTGVKPSFDVRRNMEIADIRAVARRDGVVGIGFWPQAVGGADDERTHAQLDRIVAAFRATIEALSDAQFAAEMQALRAAQGGRPYNPFEHVGFGSDFDGAVWTPIDSANLAKITARLRRAEISSMSDENLRRLAGLNVCRIFALALPGGSAAEAHQICRYD